MFTNISKISGKTEINKEFKENLFQIIRQYGEDIFEKDHLYAYMADYFPGEKEFLTLIKTLQEDGIYSKLITFRNNCGNDSKRMENAMETEMRRLQSKFFWNEEIARFCIEIFEGIGEGEESDRQSLKLIERENKAEKLTKESRIILEEIGKEGNGFSNTVANNEVKPESEYSSIKVETGQWYNINGSSFNGEINNPFIIMLESKKCRDRISFKDYMMLMQFFASIQCAANIVILCDGDFNNEFFASIYSYEGQDAKRIRYQAYNYRKNIRTDVNIRVVNDVTYQLRDLEKNKENVLYKIADMVGGEVLKAGFSKKKRVEDIQKAMGRAAKWVEKDEKILWNTKVGKRNLGQLDVLVESIETQVKGKAEEEKVVSVFIENRFQSDNRIKEYRNSTVEKILKYKSVKVNMRQCFDFDDGGVTYGRIRNPYIMALEFKNCKEKPDEKDCLMLMRFLAEDVSASENIIILCDGNFNSEFFSAINTYKGPEESKIKELAQKYSRKISTKGKIRILNNVEYPKEELAGNVKENVLYMVACLAGGEVLRSGFSEKMEVEELRYKLGKAELVETRKNDAVILQGAGKNETVEAALTKLSELSRKDNDPLYKNILSVIEEGADDAEKGGYFLGW